MRYALMDYQREAADQVLRRLQRGRSDWAMYTSPSAFALSSTTGSGKTVIATGVIEGILHGSLDLDIEADPKAAFLWVTDDPALNRQTRGRMLTASDLLSPSQLVVIENDFTEAVFQPGHVYFLNVQKLHRTSGLSTGGTEAREYSLWDVITNTIKGAGTDMYLVLDEAHKGMQPATDRQTIVRRIIDGQRGSNPPMPVVWGISATIDRFTAAMAGTHDRTTYESVEVDIEKVRASGLVKDQVNLENPDENGTFNNTLLRAAIGDTLDFEARWAAYAADQDEPLVLPVLVLQVPDKASGKLLGDLVGILDEEWSALDRDAAVHVFGEHEDMVMAGRTVKWVPPESIQDDDTVRVVLAKEAISTGWDCPRAEVLFSMRPGRDATHIAQLIGRMVRAPLARRVVTDNVLNSVSCYLPEFDRTTLDSIVGQLTQPGDIGIPPAVVIRNRSFPRNGNVEQAVFDLIESLPCLPAPDALANPLRRARTLVKLLTDDSRGSAMLSDAGAQLTRKLNGRLDGLATEHEDQIALNVANIQQADSVITTTEFGADNAVRTTKFRRTHATDIDRDFRSAIARGKEGLGKDYYAHRVRKAGDEGDPLEIKTEVTALFWMDDVIPEAEGVATKFVGEQLTARGIAIDNSVGATKDAFAKVKAQSSTPELTAIVLGSNQNAQAKDPAGAELPTLARHLFCDEQGMFPAKLNDWETAVVRTESAQTSFVAWYRNPARASTDSLRIAYQDDSKGWHSLQVDFLVVSRLGDDSLGVSIVDPHGDHLADAKAKLLALADFAEKYGDRFVRIDSIAKVGDGPLRRLNLNDPVVRAKVQAFEGAKVTPLYEAEMAIAQDYQ